MLLTYNHVQDKTMPVRFNALPSLRLLKKFFYLDPDLILVNRISRGRAKAHAAAGCLDDTNGRWRVCVGGKLFMRYRIVWALANSRYPGQTTIDHIDGDPLNDRPENLRTASHSEQRINSVRSSRPNMRGIYPYTLVGGETRYKVAINQRGTNNYVGTYKHLYAARTAYLAAVEDMGFTQFLPTGLVTLYTAHGA